VIDDDLRVLTPSQILSPATESGYGFSSNASFSRVMGQLRQGIDHFWRTWSKQYLAMLSANRYSKGSPCFINLQVGDKVLLKDYRSTNVFAGDSWTPVTVVNVHFSSDGATRKVTVANSSGEQQIVTVDKLYLTESEAFSRRQSGQDLQTYAEDRPPTADTGLPSLVPTNGGQVGVSEPSAPQAAIRIPGDPVVTEHTGMAADSVATEYSGVPAGSVMTEHSGVPVETGISTSSSSDASMALPAQPSVTSMAPVAPSSDSSMALSAQPSVAPMATKGPSVVPARRFQPSRRAKQRRAN
jgi:hypothetical protein